MNFVPVGDPRHFGEDLEVQYVADKSHAHEGGHRIAVAGREVLALPDGRTTARNRSHVITRVLSGVEASGCDSAHGVEALIGALILEGATNLTVDGQPVTPAEETIVASLRLDVSTDGEIRVTSIGGAG